MHLIPILSTKPGAAQGMDVTSLSGPGKRAASDEVLAVFEVFMTPENVEAEGNPESELAAGSEVENLSENTDEAVLEDVKEPQQIVDGTEDPAIEPVKSELVVAEVPKRSEPAERAGTGTENARPDQRADGAIGSSRNAVDMHAATPETPRPDLIGKQPSSRHIGNSLEGAIAASFKANPMPRQHHEGVRTTSEMRMNRPGLPMATGAAGVSQTSGETAMRMPSGDAGTALLQTPTPTDAKGAAQPPAAAGTLRTAHLGTEETAPAERAARKERSSTASDRLRADTPPPTAASRTTTPTGVLQPMIPRANPAATLLGVQDSDAKQMIELEGATSVSEIRLTSTQPSGQVPIVKTPEMAAHVARQLADALQAKNGGPVEVTLKPEELGQVRMTVSTVDGVVTLGFVAERPETLDLLRRHIAQLGAAFSDLGFEDMTFSFAQGADHQDADARDNPEPSGEQEGQAGPDMTAEPHVSRLSLGPLSGLDLRY